VPRNPSCPLVLDQLKQKKKKSKQLALDSYYKGRALMNNNMKLRWNYYLCNKFVRQHSYEHFEHFLIALCGRKPFDLRE
jgi:hypothetical protein